MSLNAIPMEVDIDLDQIPTECLVEEFEHRSRRNDLKDLDLYGVIDLLRLQRCPKEILTPLEDWVFLPIVDVNKLTEWTESCKRKEKQ